MRSAQKSNRARGRGNRKGNGGANLNRVYESNGPEGKVRGTPQQIIDKYLTLARDAQTAGDRVNAENFLQHAEHYQRILSAAMGQQQEQRRENQNGHDEDEARADQGGGGQGGGEQPRGDQQPRAEQQQAKGERQENRGGEREKRGDKDEARAGAVSGMQTIDSGEQDSGPELIVTPEELGGQPKKRNGGGRSRSAPEADTPAE